MTYTRKHKNEKDNKEYLTFIEKEFHVTKSGNQVLTSARLCFPKAFVKTSPKGSQYISIPAEKLLEFIMIEKDKVSEENELKEKSN
ncbi:MAG: hypothetical protein LBV53_00180 [Mycoplasmataceae bacterium]|jgi:hypothetical protein|nr:hypothetical protein [Mycoplasmataceae bacterium]